MKPKVIFFDVYQTLISIDDSGNEEAWGVFSEYLNRQGISVDALQFKKMVEGENEKYYEEVGDSEKKLRHHSIYNSVNAVFLNYDIKIGRDELLDLIWEFRQVYVSDLGLYPGVKDMLHELSKKYILSTASYAQSFSTRNELKKLGIDQYFSHFIFSSDIGYRKTSQRFFEICLQETSSNSEECLMIGDNYLQDVVTPKKAGLKAILVKNPLTDGKNVINDVEPDGVVELKDILTLPSVIRSICEV
ncbi:HAD family hydrolase [Patescibacteria group bacterium]